MHYVMEELTMNMEMNFSIENLFIIAKRQTRRGQVILRQIRYKMLRRVRGLSLFITPNKNNKNHKEWNDKEWKMIRMIDRRRRLF